VFVGRGFGPRQRVRRDPTACVPPPGLEEGHDRCGGFQFRNLRHTGATLALESGASPVLVAFRLAWRSRWRSTEACGHRRALRSATAPPWPHLGRRELDPVVPGGATPGPWPAASGPRPAPPCSAAARGGLRPRPPSGRRSPCPVNVAIPLTRSSLLRISASMRPTRPVGSHSSVGHVPPRRPPERPASRAGSPGPCRRGERASRQRPARPGHAWRGCRETAHLPRESARASMGLGTARARPG
jgi:hypothetical protein